VQRACDYCGETYEAKTKQSRFHAPKCRVAMHEARKTGKPVPAATAAPAAKPDRNTDIADRLARELTELGVDGQYEAAVVVGLARQLDSGVVTGAAYVSLSKEVDRRVDALRLKAPKPDDPAVVIRERFEEKRLRLVSDVATDTG